MEKKRQATLIVFFFFSSTNKKKCLSPTEITSAVNIASEPDEDIPQHSGTTQLEESQLYQPTEPQPGTSNIQNTHPEPRQNCNQYDIGSFSSQNCQDDQEIYNYITKTWVPSAKYKFPYGQRNLKFQHQWLSEFQWLAYSEVTEGAFCKFCAIFAAEFHVGKGAHVPLSSLVKKTIYKMERRKTRIQRP